MNDLVATMLEECSLEGPGGILLSDLYRLLEVKSGAQIDGRLQDALWKRLRQVKEIRFQQRINDAQNFSTLDDPPEKLAWNGPTQIRLIASEGMRMMTLNIHKQSGLPEPSVRILEAVARSRHDGTLQSAVSKELGLDAKTVFHYLKPLKALRLLHFVPISLQASGLQRSGRTNLMRLPRFRPRAAAGDGNDGDDGEGGGGGPGGRFKETDDVGPWVRGVVALLRAAPDMIMPETDCKRTMGSVKGNRMHHKWNRVRAALEGQGLVERVEFRRDDRKAPVVCLRLLPPAFEAAPAQPGPARPALDGPALSGIKFLAQVPLLQQVLELVAARGEEGLLQSEVCPALGFDFKWLPALVRTLTDYFGVAARAENVGRSFCFRLFAPPFAPPPLPDPALAPPAPGPARPAGKRPPGPAQALPLPAVPLPALPAGGDAARGPPAAEGGNGEGEGPPVRRGEGRAGRGRGRGPKLWTRSGPAGLTPRVPARPKKRKAKRSDSDDSDSGSGSPEDGPPAPHAAVSPAADPPTAPAAARAAGGPGGRTPHKAPRGSGLALPVRATEAGAEGGAVVVGSDDWRDQVLSGARRVAADEVRRHAAWCGGAITVQWERRAQVVVDVLRRESAAAVRHLRSAMQEEENATQGGGKCCYVDCKTADRVVEALVSLGLCRRASLALRRDTAMGAGGDEGAGAEERCDLVLLPHLGPEHPAVHAAAVRRRPGATGVGAATGARQIGWGDVSTECAALLRTSKVYFNRVPAQPKPRAPDASPPPVSAHPDGDDGGPGADGGPAECKPEGGDGDRYGCIVRGDGLPLLGDLINGYLVARMARACLLHRYLLLRFPPPPLAQPDAPGPDGGRNSFSAWEAVAAMPLSVYLQVVGCGSWLGDVRGALAADPPVSDLPPDMAATLRRTGRLGERRLGQLLDTLAALRLVAPFGAADARGVVSRRFRVEPVARAIWARQLLAASGGDGPAEYDMMGGPDTAAWAEWWCRLAAASAAAAAAVLAAGGSLATDAKAGERVVTGREPWAWTAPAPELLPRRSWLLPRALSRNERKALLDAVVFVTGGDAGCGEEIVARGLTPVQLHAAAGRSLLPRERAARFVSPVEAFAPPFAPALVPSAAARVVSALAAPPPLAPPARKRRRAPRRGDGSHDEAGPDGEPAPSEARPKTRRRRAPAAVEAGADGGPDGSDPAPAPAPPLTAAAARALARRRALDMAAAAAAEAAALEGEEVRGGAAARSVPRRSSATAPRRSGKASWAMADDFRLVALYAAECGRLASLPPRRRGGEARGCTDGSRLVSVCWRTVAAPLGRSHEQCLRRFRALRSDADRLRRLHRLVEVAVAPPGDGAGDGAGGEGEEGAGDGPSAAEVWEVAGDAERRELFLKTLDGIHLRLCDVRVAQVVSSTVPVPPLPRDVAALRRAYAVRRLAPGSARTPARAEEGGMDGEEAGDVSAEGVAGCLAEAVVSALASVSTVGRRAAAESVAGALGRVGEADVAGALGRLRQTRAVSASRRRVLLSHRTTEALAPPRRFRPLLAAAHAYSAAVRRTRAPKGPGGPEDGGPGPGGEGTWELGYTVSDGAAAATVELMLAGLLHATPAAPALMTDEDAAAAVAGAAAGSGGTRGHLSVLRTMLEAEADAPDAPRPVSEGLPLIEAQVVFSRAPEDELDFLRDPPGPEPVGAGPGEPGPAGDSCGPAGARSDAGAASRQGEAEAGRAEARQARVEEWVLGRVEGAGRGGASLRELVEAWGREGPGAEEDGPDESGTGLAAVGSGMEEARRFGWLDRALVALMNRHRVIRVRSRDGHRFVASAVADPWTFPSPPDSGPLVRATAAPAAEAEGPPDPSNPADAHRFDEPQVAGPWLKPCGADNTGFMSGLRAGLLHAIVTSPGVSVATLAARYGVLVPQTVVDVLASLHLDGLIAVRALLTPKCALFSAPVPPFAERLWDPLAPDDNGGWDPARARGWLCFPRPDVTTRFAD